jgi:hypothetical protein
MKRQPPPPSPATAAAKIEQEKGEGENKQEAKYRDGANPPTALRAVRTNDEIENTNASSNLRALVFSISPFVRERRPQAGVWRVRAVPGFSFLPSSCWILTAKAA